MFEEDLQAALTTLRRGELILYPTDTVWGIGCDATDYKAVAKIFRLKKRDEKKSMIVLLADERDIMRYVAAPDPSVFEFIKQQSRPTTVILDDAIGLAANLISEDGTIAIRIVQDEFCRHLIKRLQKPIVSTSANISNQQAPATFSEISKDIKRRVDYVVNWRQDDATPAQPSRIIKWNRDGSHKVIRE